jgi:hypothetical protein
LTEWYFSRLGATHAGGCIFIVVVGRPQFEPLGTGYIEGG